MLLQVLGKLVAQLQNHEEVLEKLVGFIPKEYVQGTIFRQLCADDDSTAPASSVISPA